MQQSWRSVGILFSMFIRTELRLFKVIKLDYKEQIKVIIRHHISNYINVFLFIEWLRNINAQHLVIVRLKPVLIRTKRKITHAMLVGQFIDS